MKNKYTCLVAIALALTLCSMVVQSAMPFHTFDSNNQGWLVTGASGYQYTNVTGSIPSSNGTLGASWDHRGNPGGALVVSDQASETFISAPSSFLGNQSDMYMGSFSYDIYIRYTDAQPYTSVGITGNGLTLAYYGPSAWYPTLNTWQTRTVIFDPALWRKGNNIVATADDLQSVLSNLTGLYIRTEWHSGADDTSIDNIGADSTGYSISATVNLGDYGASPEGIPVTVELLNDTYEVLRTDNTTLDADSVFHIYNVEPGTYYVAIKPSHWLRKITGPITVSSADVVFVIQ